MCLEADGSETPIPEAALKPRNYNPHPYQHSLAAYNENALQNVEYVPQPSNSIRRQAQLNRPSPSASPKNGIYRWIIVITIFLCS